MSLTVESNTEKLDVMLVFRQLQSPVERDLFRYIESQGGPEKFLQSDEMMDELRARMPASSDEDDSTEMSRVELLEEYKTSVAELLKANEELFTRKFDAQQAALTDEMENIMVRQGDRIIRALKIGAAYERLIDPVRLLLRLSDTRRMLLTIFTLLTARL